MKGFRLFALSGFLALALAGCETVREPGTGAQPLTAGKPVAATLASQKGSPFWRHKRLWCAEILNWSLAQNGIHGTGSNQAISFAQWGERRQGRALPGDVYVTRGGTHTGIILEDHGDRVVIISGNWGRDVGIATISRKMIASIRSKN